MNVELDVLCIRCRHVSDERPDFDMQVVKILDKVRRAKREDA